MGCSGLCEKYRAGRASSRLHYISGQKRCQYCSLFIKTTKNRFPCCNYKLRLSPRSSKHKHRFLQSKHPAVLLMHQEYMTVHPTERQPDVNTNYARPVRSPFNNSLYPSRATVWSTNKQTMTATLI
jgi:hypothetical protein